MKEYLKMSDVFKGELFIDSDCDDVIVDDLSLTVLESFSGADSARFALHAINSHDELVAEVERLSGIIERAILSSNDLAGRCASTQWGDGYRECAIDTGNALKVELNKGA